MPWFSDDDAGVGDGFTVCGPPVVVPGLYARLLEHERVVRPDPRWRFTEAGRRGEPCLPDWGQPRKSLILEALERGRPVQMPGWCHHLGSQSFPELGEAIPGLPQAIAHLENEFGKWVVLVVHPDDTVVPRRRA